MKKVKKSIMVSTIQSSFKRNCPFVDEPFEYCYCASTNSINVKHVIRYCGGNFEECEIYKHSMRSDE